MRMALQKIILGLSTSPGIGQDPLELSRKAFEGFAIVLSEASDVFSITRDQLLKGRYDLEVIQMFTKEISDALADSTMKEYGQILAKSNSREDQDLGEKIKSLKERAEVLMSVVAARAGPAFSKVAGGEEKKTRLGTLLGPSSPERDEAYRTYFKLPGRYDFEALNVLLFVQAYFARTTIDEYETILNRLTAKCEAPCEATMEQLIDKLFIERPAARAFQFNARMNIIAASILSRRRTPEALYLLEKLDAQSIYLVSRLNTDGPIHPDEYRQTLKALLMSMKKDNPALTSGMSSVNRAAICVRSFVKSRIPRILEY